MITFVVQNKLKMEVSMLDILKLIRWVSTSELCPECSTSGSGDIQCKCVCSLCGGEGIVPLRRKRRRREYKS